MSWVVALAVLAAVGALLAARRYFRGRRAAIPIDDALMTTTGEPRVRQFLRTGSHRMPEPDSGPGDLRKEARTQLEEKEAAADLATLNAFLADVRDSLGADEAVFWRWSAERDSLSPFAWSTPDVKRPAHFDMRSWGALVQWAAEGRMLHFDADARVGVARLAACPIQLDDRLMGVLSVSRAEGLERGRDHIKAWLPRHAAQVGRLVALFEVRRDYGRYMHQGQALLAAAQRVQGHKSQEALIKAICETAVEVSSASEAALIRWRSEAGRGWVQYTTSGIHHKAPFPLSQESLTAKRCMEGLPLLIEDVSKMTRPQSLFTDGDDAWPRGTIAMVPLSLDNRTIGCIVVAADSPNAIPYEEARNVALLGALAATSLEMVWEMEEVNRRARTDALTGLPNRREFDQQLGTLIAQADRFGHSVSLIMTDVDHFKNVNDTYGHEAGDQVLKSIAKTLSDTVRQVDVAARFGGEEIAILLPQTSLTGAVELADRLRRQVEAKPIVVGGNEIAVTISCGVACYPDGVLTKEALFAAADRALYDAKNAGRNCVKSAVAKPTGAVRQ